MTLTDPGLRDLYDLKVFVVRICLHVLASFLSLPQPGFFPECGFGFDARKAGYGEMSGNGAETLKAFWIK